MGTLAEAVGSAGNLTLSPTTSGTLTPPSPEYTKTFNDFLNEMKGKSITVLMQEGYACEIRLKRDGKKLMIEFKHIAEDRIHKFTEDKVKAYDTSHGIVAATFSIVGSLLCAAAPAISSFNPQT